jgi:phosphatidylserine/phosphatidylglycerophosphate/cardiolipin synthase-like enzyme
LKLLTQPADGIAPLVAAIKNARKSVDIVIFRFDRAELEAGLKAAVGRGILVSALIAYANRGGEKSLRKLEMRLLAAGVTVSRTASDLVRYHDKLLIIDRRTLYALSFNFTHLDIDHSRGFGIVTRKSELVREALKLLDADNARTPYEAGSNDFVVSPVNARKQLTSLIGRARKEILIYDPKVADPGILRALNARLQKGVKVRIIGAVGKKSHSMDVRPLSGLRLHTRTIIRDGREAFVGSQSLRVAELDSRREVGVIVRGSKLVNGLVKTFEADWERKKVAADAPDTTREIKKKLKTMVKKLSPLNPLVKEAVSDVVSKVEGKALDATEMKTTVEKAVKEAVRERVSEMLNESEED